MSSRNGKYLLGIDVGSSAMKTTMFDSRLRVIANSVQEYPIIHIKPNWAEHSPDVWWSSLKRNVSSVLRRSKISPRYIAAICISDLAPVTLPVDKEGKPLRPAIIWMDRRDGIFGKKYLWIMKNEPNIFAKTYKFLTASAFLNFKLTGGFVSYRFSELPKELSEKNPEFFVTGEILGEITSAAARETGLAKGTPVVSGENDGFCAVIGSGIVRAGQAADMHGTSECLIICTNKPISGLDAYHYILPRKWINAICLTASGGSLAWLKDILGFDDFEGMDYEASKVSFTDDKMIFLPYLAGRSQGGPLDDICARGVFFGLHLSHKRGHLIRAVLEGCAFGLRQMIETVEALGPKVKEVRITGGGSRSKLWSQIKADVIGRPIVQLRTSPISETVGDAMIAGVGVGVFKDFVTASKLLEIEKVFSPDPDKYNSYTETYDIYKGVYDQVKLIFPKLSRS